MCIGGEADVQHTPADITGLHGSLQVEASSGGVVQSDVLVFIGQKRKLVIQISQNLWNKCKNERSRCA